MKTVILAGGLGAHAIGLRATFLVASIGFPLVYFALAAAVRRRQGHLHSGDGRGEPKQQTA